MVANVAGDHVELVTIVGPDGDTELYQPTLADSRTVAGARIVFMNDLNDEFEPWLEPLLKQAGFTGTKVVASRGAKTDHRRGGASDQRQGSRSGDRPACLARSQERHCLRQEHRPSPGASRPRQCRRLPGARRRLYQAAAGSSMPGRDRDDRRSCDKAARHCLARLAAISGQGLRHHADLDQRLDQQKRAVGGRAGTSRPSRSRRSACTRCFWTASPTRAPWSASPRRRAL